MSGIMQDYDYYEANAKDVKLEDITSDADNADILARLRDDDPEFTGLQFTEERYDDDDFFFVIREGDHLGWLGYFVGRSDKLTELSIFDFPDDINLNAFFRGLEHNRSIEKLDILTDLGESLRSLIPFVRSNDSLRNLTFNGFDIGLQCARNIAMLLGQQSSLKRLSFEETDHDEEGFKGIVAALGSLPQMEELSLSSSNVLMESVLGLRSLGTLVRRTASMHSLSLCGCSLTDEGLQSFVEDMANCCSLTNLDLSCNPITANGLESLSSLLRAEHCSLRTLSLCDIHLGEEGAIVLANGLRRNKLLTNLKFSTPGITARGWAAFRRLLCDKSSVNNTYLSNHTLVQIGLFGSQETPRDIVICLKLNKLQNQAAAICKILLRHPDIEVTPLFQFNLMCLPLVVEWFEKAKSNLGKVNVSTDTDVFRKRQLSAAYKFIRGMPLLAANGFRSQKVKDAQLQVDLNSRKRKLDQTA